MRDYYRILSLIGAGAFGEVRTCVFREKKTETKTFFKQYRAVKIISKNHMDEKGRASFFNEVDIMLDLSGEYDRMKKIKENKAANKTEEVTSECHPSIVNMFHYFEDTKRYLLISEYCKGGELFQYIQNENGKIEHDLSALILK